MTAELDALRAEVERIPIDGHWWVHRGDDGRRSVVWDAVPHMVWSAGDEEWCVAERERLNADPRAATILASLRGYVTLTSASGHTLDAARLAEMLAFVRTEPLRLGIARANADADKAYSLWQANNGKLVKALDAIGVAVEARQQAEATRDAAQARATACEARARKAEQQAADAAGLLVLAERQLSEWKATAVRGAEMVRAAEGRGVSLFAAGYWADTVLAQTKPDIDPAAGTSDHELEPGRNDEPAGEEAR